MPHPRLAVDIMSGNLGQCYTEDGEQWLLFVVFSANDKHSWAGASWFYGRTYTMSINHWLYTRTLQDRLLSVAGVIGLQVKIFVMDSQPKEPGSPQFHQILDDCCRQHASVFFEHCLNRKQLACLLGLSWFGQTLWNSLPVNICTVYSNSAQVKISSYVRLTYFDLLDNHVLSAA